MSILLVSSVMVPLAVVIFPGITLPLSNAGIVKLRAKVSESSTILSIVTGTFIMTLVDPGMKVALIGVEV